MMEMMAARAIGTDAPCLTDWLGNIPNFVEQLDRHRFTDDLVLAERLYTKCESYMSLLHCLCYRTLELRANQPRNPDTAFYIH